MSDLPPSTPPPPRHPLTELVFVRLPHVLLGLLLLIAIGINLANIVGRYVFGAAVFWSEEVMIFMIIWAVFIAAATVTYKGEHLIMDLFSAMYPPWAKRLLRLVVNLLFIAVVGFLLYQSWRVLGLHAMNGTRSMAAGVPMVIPHAALGIGFLLVIVACIYRIVTGSGDGSPPPQI